MYVGDPNFGHAFILREKRNIFQVYSGQAGVSLILQKTRLRCPYFSNLFHNQSAVITKDRPTINRLFYAKD